MLISATLPMSPNGRWTGRTLLAGGVQWTVGDAIDRTEFSFSSVERYEVHTEAATCHDDEGRRRATKGAAYVERYSDEPSDKSFRISTDVFARVEWTAWATLVEDPS